MTEVMWIQGCIQSLIRRWRSLPANITCTYEEAYILAKKNVNMADKPARKLMPLVELCFIILACVYLYMLHSKIQANTERAELLIQGGQYDEAIDFLEINKFSPYDENLIVYANAKKMAENNASTETIYFLLRDIEYYKGNLTKDMFEMRSDYSEKYYAELKPKEKKVVNQHLEEMKKKLPYVGMSTDDINNTMVGRYDTVHKEKQSYGHKLHYNNKYIWYDDSGKYEVLIVWSYDGEVTKVCKYYEDTFWTASGKPNFGASDDKIVQQRMKAKERRDRINSAQSNNSRNGSYDVDDYDSPEDFADDADYDFDDWDDAYNYWEDNY